jgi:4-hydroxybenzoate polyprenyltransferase/phosphoserine phosphatase
MMEDTQRPLVVDLDGTLIYSDLLVESALLAVKEHPGIAFSMFSWLKQGKATLKQQLAERAHIDVANLPWNAPFLAWLKEQHQSGRRLVLATASDSHYAKQVNSHIGLFESVLASENGHNLSSENKRAALVARFGERGYDYAGNGKADLAVWGSAHEAIVVNASAGLEKKIDIPIAKTFPQLGGQTRAWMHALRLHQWLKNVLLFLPLLAAHQFNPALWGQAILGYLCFGICASSVYLLNDLVDLTSDRHHPRKRLRAFAAGKLHPLQGIIVAPILLLVGVGTAAVLSPPFAAVLLMYYGLTLAYSFGLKRVAMLDVLMLAALYTIRIVAGAALTHIQPSFWLLSFAMFFFLCLAFLKRYIELIDLQMRKSSKAKGRGYRADDASMVAAQGSAAGYIAVLVLAFYINSPDVWSLYHEPRWLWGICVSLLYWLNRSWWLAHRGKLHDDPVIYAVTDRTSRIILLIVAGLLALASTIGMSLH